MLAFIKESDHQWFVEIDRLRIDVEATEKGWMITSVLTDPSGDPCADSSECEYEDGCPDGCSCAQPVEVFNSCVWSDGGESLSDLVKAMRKDLLSSCCELPDHIKSAVADGWQIRLSTENT